MTSAAYHSKNQVVYEPVKRFGDDGFEFVMHRNKK